MAACPSLPQKVISRVIGGIVFITTIMKVASCKRTTLYSTSLFSVNFPNLFRTLCRFVQYFAVQTFLPLLSSFLNIIFFPPMFPGCCREFILSVHVILQNLYTLLLADCLVHPSRGNLFSCSVVSIPYPLNLIISSVVHLGGAIWLF